MRFVTVRDLRGKPRQIWNELSKGKQMVITSNGKPVAILSPTSEDTFEESLELHKQVKAMRALRQLQETSAKNGTGKMSMREIDAEIRVARRRARR